LGLAPPDLSTPYGFVSYCHVDRARVNPVVGQLRAAGIPMWRDKEHLEPGTEFPEKIREALAGSTVVLAFLSREAIDSLAVRRELESAVALRKAIVPVALDPGGLAHGIPGLRDIQAVLWYEVDRKYNWIPGFLIAPLITLPSMSMNSRRGSAGSVRWAAAGAATRAARIVKAASRAMRMVHLLFRR
jgi:hypothetical protein